MQVKRRTACMPHDNIMWQHVDNKNQEERRKQDGKED